jgi:hypothetical protein
MNGPAQSVIVWAPIRRSKPTLCEQSFGIDCRSAAPPDVMNVSVHFADNRPAVRS